MPSFCVDIVARSGDHLDWLILSGKQDFLCCLFSGAVGVKSQK